MNIYRNKYSTEAAFVFAEGKGHELAFSFCDCAPMPQKPQITVLSDWADQSDQSDSSDYTVIASAARDFCGWITVTAKWFCRAIVRVFLRIICEAKAVFNRRVLIRQGGLRL